MCIELNLVIRMADDSLTDLNRRPGLLQDIIEEREEVNDGEVGVGSFDISQSEIGQGREGEQSMRVDPAILQQKVERVIRSVEESSREITHKWSEFLTEGEEFEELCLQRLDQLIIEAQLLEEAVIEQKQKLFERTQQLADILCKYKC